MAFDKHHYKTVKVFVLDRLSHRPWCCNAGPVEWIKSFFPLIQSAVDDEDYEAAKATRDAIIEFLNSYGLEIPDDVTLKLTIKSQSEPQQQKQP